MERMYYRPEEVATLLRLGRTKVYELLGSGALPSVRIGRARRVAAHDLQMFLTGLERTR